MAEKLTYDINVGGNAVESIGNVKKALKEANAELINAQANFGDYSDQAISAAKRVAELKDRISEAKETADLFDPGKKFQAFAGAINAVAGGFAAVQGGLGLLGVESDEVQKSLLKVQSALALSQGLNVITDATKDFQRLGSEIKNSTVFIKANEMANKAAAFAMKLFGVSVETTSTSFKVLKGAIAATGLGLLVVAIGEIVAAFQEYSSAAEKAAEKQKQLNEAITNGAKTALKGEQDFLANQEKLDIARAKSRGASEQEIFDIEQRYRELKAEAQIRFWKETKNADAEGAAAAAGEVKKINIDAQVAQLEFQTKQAEARRAAAKAAADELANIESARIEKQLADEKKLTEQELAEYDKRRGQAKNAKILTQKELNYLDEQDRIKKQEEDNKKFETQQANLKKIGSFTYDSIVKDQKLKEDARKAELQADIFLQNAKFEAASAGLNLLSSLAGENEKIANAIFVIDKALAIAKIVVDTQREISAYASNPTWSILPDGGAIIKAKYILGAKIRAGAGIAAIAATSIAKFKGGGSAGGATAGGASAPSISAGAPLAPPPPQAQTTTLDSQSINALGSQTSRAYVLESDVTNSQQRIAAIQQRARFG